MPTASRTIYHYSLRVISNINASEESPEIIRRCFNYIISLDRIHRRIDGTSKKFHLLSHLTDHGNYLTGCFNSAKYDYRPPLIDKTTLSERVSPKTRNEGEKELTHFAAYIDENDVLLVLEQKKSGVSIQMLVTYLNSFLKVQGIRSHISWGLSVSGSFDSKIMELNRATSVEIFVPYTQCTDTFGGDPISTINVKSNAKITLTAEKSTSIKSAVSDFYKKMTNHTADIKRIRVYGKSQENTHTLLDTNRLKDKTVVNVDVDTNNQVESGSMFRELIKIMEEQQ